MNVSRRLAYNKKRIHLIVADQMQSLMDIASEIT